MSISTIAPQELYQRHQDGQTIELIDVRTPAEYRATHATLARNEPLDHFDPARLAADHNGSSDEPLYVICQSGSRGHKACQQLIAAGYPNVVNVSGGTQAWEQAGLPVVRGKKTVSLERQVRIAAGFLVLLGAVLSVVHPAFVILSGLVGAGLIFAGITDSCAMGMLLARMPWNQVDAGPAGAA